MKRASRIWRIRADRSAVGMGVGSLLGIVVEALVVERVAVADGDAPEASGNESRRRMPRDQPAMTSTTTIATTVTTHGQMRRRGDSRFDELRSVMLVLWRMVQEFVTVWVRSARSPTNGCRSGVA